MKQYLEHVIRGKKVGLLTDNKSSRNKQNSKLITNPSGIICVRTSKKGLMISRKNEYQRTILEVRMLPKQLQQLQLRISPD